MTGERITTDGNGFVACSCCGHRESTPDYVMDDVCRGYVRRIRRVWSRHLSLQPARLAKASLCLWCVDRLSGLGRPLDVALCREVQP